MKIISKRKQKELEANIWNILKAIQIKDDIMLLNSIEDVFDIAYAIGGMSFVQRVNDRLHEGTKAAIKELQNQHKKEKENKNEKKQI